MIRERNTPDTPLDDEYEALRILCHRSHRHGAYLCLNYSRRDDGVGTVRLKDLYKGPRIVVQCLGGYADMEVRQENVTYVTERVVSKLRDWTRGAPHWGYTDEYERHVTEFGDRHYSDTGRGVGDGVETLVHWLHTEPSHGRIT